MAKYDIKCCENGKTYTIELLPKLYRVVKEWQE